MRQLYIFGWGKWRGLDLNYKRPNWTQNSDRNIANSTCQSRISIRKFQIGKRSEKIVNGCYFFFSRYMQHEFKCVFHFFHLYSYEKYWKIKYFLHFRSFSPTPRGLEFHPGQDYYFISTSSRRDIHRRVGGSCSTNNMKVMFKVAKNREEKNPAINVPRSLSTSIPDLSSPSFRSDLTEEEYKDMVRPIEDVRSFHSGLDQITKERYDRNHNSVVKQEASTMSRTSRTIESVFLVIICALTALFRALRYCWYRECNVENGIYGSQVLNHCSSTSAIKVVAV